jgi:hypothetical protein
MKTKRLPQEILKLIACIAMFIDHFGDAIVPNLHVPYVDELYYTCRIIGRIAFPIYGFLLVQGMTHTRNPYQYILRLGMGIPLAELPFDYLFEGNFTWECQNVMVTLTLGAVMLLCMQKTEEKWRKALMVIPFAVFADLCKCDYGGWGIGIIAVFAFFDQLSLQTIGMLLINWTMNSAVAPVFGMRIPNQIFAVLAMIPIAGYSGIKLTRSKAVQWGFYLFYPMHMLVLWVIVELIG